MIEGGGRVHCTRFLISIILTQSLRLGLFAGPVVSPLTDLKAGAIEGQRSSAQDNVDIHKFFSVSYDALTDQIFIPESLSIEVLQVQFGIPQIQFEAKLPNLSLEEIRTHFRLHLTSNRVKISQDDNLYYPLIEKNIEFQVSPSQSRPSAYILSVENFLNDREGTTYVFVLQDTRSPTTSTFAAFINTARIYGVLTPNGAESSTPNSIESRLFETPATGADSVAANTAGCTTIRAPSTSYPWSTMWILLFSLILVFRLRHQKQEA